MITITKKLSFISLFTTLFVLPVVAISGVAVDPAQSIFSARQLGIGGVSLGFDLDANSVFTNPADLVNSQFPQLAATSRNIALGESTYLLSALAIPTDFGLFGVGYVGLSTGGSLPTMRDPATGRIMVDPSSEATNFTNNALVLAYARSIPNWSKLNVGGNFKLINQNITGTGGDKGAGWGIDLGATYQHSSWLILSANAQNLLSSPVKWSRSEDKLGGYYKFGGKINYWGSSGEALIAHSQKIDLGLELDLPNNVLSASNGLLLHAGAEYSPLKNIFLRGGLNQEAAGTGLTLGVGVVNDGFRFDYAYLQRPGLPGDNPHYFSLSYIGERVLSYHYKLRRKESGIVWLNPKDKSITDAPEIILKAQVQEKRIVDQKRLWTVTGVSETFEVQEIAQYQDMPTIYLNGIKIDQTGTIESTTALAMGRNVFEIVAYSSPEVMPGKKDYEIFGTSSEVRVLRFKPFKDTPLDFWAIEPIALSVTLGLVKGYPNDTFKPEKGITRAELVTLLVRTMPVHLAEEVTETGFSDVPKKHWAARYIAYGAFKKLVTGYPDGKFLPNKVLTRAEGVTIMARYANLPEKLEAKQPFPDLKENFWANKYIDPARETGLLNYLLGKNFEPSVPFARAEACEILTRTPAIKAGIDEYWNTGIVSAQPPTVLATQEAQQP
jgi:hypothetical protein